jgi:phosphatidylserine/phosphatidylglycerophosphate/cardiolipin synthase-like enzyme
VLPSIEKEKTMRKTAKSGGLTVRAIAGSNNVLIGIDLDPAKRAGCLGFTLQRSDVGTPALRFLPNSITFASTPEATLLDTENSPLQKFRWGDYTCKPGTPYRYTVTARYRDGNGTPVTLKDGDSVEVDVTTEDPAQQATAVFFNRAAAASQAYIRKFGDADPTDLPAPKNTEALAWLSRGLEEALLAFQSQALDKTFGLHCAVYEFQKENLLGGLKAALDRGADVQVVYHYRHAKNNAKDKTWSKNEAAAKAAGLTAICTQRTQTPGVIMHNKFMVLLKDNKPIAVWTGSTNWTDGGIYGQLNVGHAVYDPNVAAIYEGYFQLLKKDLPDAAMKAGVRGLGAVPKVAAAGVAPILSPQSDRAMLTLYGAIAASAQCVLFSAPFALAKEITDVLGTASPGSMRYVLADKESSLGKDEAIKAIEKIPGNIVAYAATLPSNLTSFQDKLLKASAESYHHAGVHIHSKIILADPFGDNPILVTGSANFSTNSTMHNDSNSLLVRGDTRVADIYSTEFMRMFEQYHFRAAKKKANDTNTVITLSETDAWSNRYYVDGSAEAIDRMLFAGTLPATPVQPGKPPVPSPPPTKPPAPQPPNPPASKPPASKPPVSKPPVSKPPVSKPPVSKPPVSKPPSKKASSKKAATKKAATKKAATKKAATKKAASKKAATKKAGTKKAAKKSSSTKSAAKKASSKKSSKKAAKKPTKKAPARKSSAKKASKKAPAKKSAKKPAKKSSKKSAKKR